MADELQNLTFSFFNVENLFLLLDLPLKAPLDSYNEVSWQKLSQANTANKPLEKAKEVARALLDMSPDVVALAEVGGEESFRHFNKLFLNETYEVQMLEGNSDRGIDVGFLVKKSLPLKFEIWTHRNRPLNFLYPEDPPERRHYLSRDVAELRVFSPHKNEPLLIVLLVHLKSKLDPEGIDPLGQKRRAAELQCLIDIYQEVRKQWSTPTPVLITGDFNGNASPQDTSVEFLDLYEKTDLIELFDFVNLPMEKRPTQLQIFPGGFEERLQIDYFFISPELRKTVIKENSYVYHYKDKEGSVLPWPSSLTERMQLPSDHYPIFMELDFKKLQNLK